MKKYPGLRFLIIIAIILIIGFLISPTGILKPVKNFFFQIIKPFSTVGNVIIDSGSKIVNNLVYLRSISQENEKLIKENLELQSELSVLKEAQHENEILKNELGFFNSKGDLKLIPANIVGRSVSGYLSTVVIDRGSKDNVKVGQALVSQGFLVGTAKEVFDNTSQVTLITDYNSLVPVVLQESRGTGLLRGGLGGLTIEDIPLNIDIKPGEQVVTSGLGGEIPPGVLAGKVGEVISKKGEIFQKVTLESPIQIFYLEFVFVVLSND